MRTRERGPGRAVRVGRVSPTSAGIITGNWFSIVSLTDNGGLVLMTTAGTHGLRGGEFIRIIGSSVAGYNLASIEVVSVDSATTATLNLVYSADGSGGTWADADVNAPDLTTALLAHWAMTEASGNRADSTAGAWTLTQTGTVGSADGLRGGNAADFDGVDDLLNSAQLTGDWLTLETTGFTVAAWINPDSDVFGTLVRFRNGTTRQLLLLSRNDASSLAGACSYDLRTSGGTLLVTDLTTTVAAPGAWSFVAAGFDPTDDGEGNGNGFIYLNGEYRENDYPIASGNPDLSGTPTVRMGASQTGGTLYDGRLGQVSAWKRPLLESELHYLFNSGKGRYYPYN